MARRKRWRRRYVSPDRDKRTCLVTFTSYLLLNNRFSFLSSLLFLFQPDISPDIHLRVPVPVSDYFHRSYFAADVVSTNVATKTAYWWCNQLSGFTFISSLLPAERMRWLWSHSFISSCRYSNLTNVRTTSRRETQIFSQLGRKFRRHYL